MEVMLQKEVHKDMLAVNKDTSASKEMLYQGGKDGQK